MHSLRRAWAVVLVLSGCASAGGSEAFAPVENGGTIAPLGHRASVYPLVIDDELAGKATVWSHGAERLETGDDTYTAVHVGLLVESKDRPLRVAVEQVLLETVLIGDVEYADIEPSSIDGVPQLPAHSLTLIDFHFAMPDEVEPQAVDAFHLRWAVTDPERGGRYAQRTPFIDDPERYAPTVEFDDVAGFDPYAGAGRLAPPHVIVAPAEPVEGPRVHLAPDEQRKP